MLVLLSPSKTLDFSPPRISEYTFPELLNESEVLMKELSKLSPKDIQKLMKVSEAIAHTNFERFQNFKLPFTSDNSKQALLAFTGAVYTGIEVGEYTSEDFAFAQKHLRTLSGLYGVLRPLDLMQPYRLEMGRPLQNPHGKDLYAFWGTQIAERLKASLTQHADNIVVNLASQEYFRSVDTKALGARIVTPIFKENKDGKYKTIAIYAKKARGKMANYIIRGRIEDVEKLKRFREDGYQFDTNLSEEDEWVFVR